MVVLATCIGLLCIILADSLSNAAEVLLALLAAVALFVPLTLMVKIVAMNKATYASVATGVVSNVLSDVSDTVGWSDSDEEDQAATE